MGKVRALSSDPSDGIFFFEFRANTHSDRPYIIQAPKRHYEENLLDGLRVYHNPFGTHPLDPSLFRHPSVFQVWHEGDEIKVEQRDGQLLNRFMFTLLPQERSPSTLARHL
jgi:hypothetical protein